MNPRHTSILVLLQVLSLGAAILFSAFATRFGERMQEISIYNTGPGYMGAARLFRDYGWWFIMAIAAWTVAAVYSDKWTSLRSQRIVMIAGFCIVAFFAITAFNFFFLPFAAQ